jgi:predicted TIM-barrel fold metal-dependent hydrolase
VNSVIDVHAHIGHTIASHTGQTYDEYLATMDRLGIERAIISVAAGGRQVDGLRDSMRQNDTIAEAMRAHPDRFPVGLAGVEVRHAEKAVEELERAFTELGLQGMVFHPTFEGLMVGFTDVLDPLFELATEFSALCLMHATTDMMGSPVEIARLAGRYPGVTMIMGHPALAPAQRDEAVEAARGHDNLFVDVAYQQDPATTEILVNALGAEHVIFGSDAPFYDIAATIESVRGAQIPDEARERVLYGNGAALIDQFSAPRRRAEQSSSAA